MKRKQNLYLIYSKNFRNWEDRLLLLEKASEKLNLNPIRIFADDFDYSIWEEIPACRTDMFYNVTPFSHEIENIFIHKGLTSFFIEPNKLNYLFSTHQLDLSLINGGIPVPKTILKGTADRKLLKKYVDYLGGFPLIVKATGGSTGIGVMKVDTIEGLFSTCDFIESQKLHFQLKQFVKNEGTYRVFCIGSKIISFYRKNLTDDFRVSNGKDYDWSLIQLNEKYFDSIRNIQKIVNYEFIGLDLIIDSEGNPYVLEVNFPNNFAPVQKFIKIDIAFEAIKFLKEKSLR